MKVRVVFKDPDVVALAIQEAVANKGGTFREEGELAVRARKWFKYGEYVTIEWDTEANTCTVIPQ